MDSDNSDDNPPTTEPGVFFNDSLSYLAIWHISASLPGNNTYMMGLFFEVFFFFNHSLPLGWILGRVSILGWRCRIPGRDFRISMGQVGSQNIFGSSGLKYFRQYEGTRASPLDPPLGLCHTFFHSGSKAISSPFILDSFDAKSF